MLPYAVPRGLLSHAGLGPDWSAWLDDLPRRVAEVVEEWGLSYDGEPWHGYCSLLLPVRTSAGRPSALKVAFPDGESEHEHLALRHWDGRGAVRLLRADPRRWAILLERLHREDLCSAWDLTACEVVGGLYPRLHVPAPPSLRRLSSCVLRWSGGLRALPADAPLPRRLVDQAGALAAGFATDPATDGTLVHGDLHYANVLSGDREPWLAIDPKPLSGDPHYEVAPMLWNRWEEAVGTGSAREAVRRRFYTVVDTADLDEDRARDWVVVRALCNGLWAVQEAQRAGRSLSAGERTWVTTSIAVAKAVQG